jgi:cell division protein FtsQ
MAVIVSVSRKDLAQRRQTLRRQRQIRIVTAIWRTLASAGCASGLFWIAVQPMWVLKSPAQIVMKSGNHLLPESTIKSLLNLSYPQSLWRIQPTAIAKSLEMQPAISQVYVSRRLFPPGLIINIDERVPVAIAESDHREDGALQCIYNSLSLRRTDVKFPSQCFLQKGNTSQGKDSLGLIDAKGIWMSLKKYTSISDKLKLPSLKIVGSPKQYHPYWYHLYQALNQSDVKITEIDCENSSDLILLTELGPVHLGVPDSQLSEKFQVLDQIRYLPSKLSLSKIEYIDLKNPAIPLVQLKDDGSDKTAPRPKIP